MDSFQNLVHDNLCILGILYDLLLDLPQKTNCTRGLVGAWSGLGQDLAPLKALSSCTSKAGMLRKPLLFC